ncbi:hypothetical protein A3Q56_06226 [Intoshia linei]|uniref:Serpin domain-containing protein n=1 Tax=Intoshia linei TaxID=1819745 RepID=A0A177AVH8_9BILA|nr:hypothetical protein A3Q56_06226 [Intoshia linei]
MSKLLCGDEKHIEKIKELENNTKNVESIIKRPLNNNYEFQVINKIYVSFDYVINKNYIHNLTVHGFDNNLIERINFYKNDHAIKSINEYIFNATNRRISQFLLLENITSDAKLVLVNMLNFSCRFKIPFSEENTTTYSFLRRNGTYTRLKTMFVENYFYYVSSKTWDMVEIPLEVEQFTLLIALPKQNIDINQEQINEYFEENKYFNLLQLYLPRFNVSNCIDYAPYQDDKFNISNNSQISHELKLTNFFQHNEVSINEHGKALQKVKNYQ